MEKKHRNVLRRMQPDIVRDLDIHQIIDVLIAEHVVEDPLWDEIQAIQSRSVQIRKLLMHLPKRGPNAYSIVKEAMRKNYPWLSERMDNLETTVDSVDAPHVPFSPQSLLPANPPLSVERREKTDQLRNKLRELEPGCYLVLHALQGYGKSTLASATLKEDKDLLEESFQNEIYWIKFAQSQTLAETILIQLNLLFHKVKNLDLLAEPTSEDSLQYSLKKHFSEHNYALLILDDVNSKEIIDAFDFGCKTLVLTTDMDVLKGRKNTVIKMSDGFTLNESLRFFSDATGIPVAKLPRQAHQIHYECKGMPLMISMFAAQFGDVKESLTEGEADANWLYYLNALREKKSNVVQESLEQLTTMFNICIEKLSEDDKQFFKTLAIFPEDVNITTQTLSIYWDVAPAAVDFHMSKFCKKSLACREWHECFKFYIYGIHNLVLDHLRQNTPDEVLRDLHRRYVDKNLLKCNGDFSKLPSDNYVHSYIGYHMDKGKMVEKFRDVYLDFSFIEAKILHVGPGDLLIDLKKYRDLVTREDPMLQYQVDDLERFLVQQASTLAEYRRRNCLDLVQVALKHPFPGFVRDKAELLAEERKSRLYLYHLKRSEEYLTSSSQELVVGVWSVAFTNEADVILIGSDKGNIIMWNCSSRSYVPFHGNSDQHPITKIVPAIGAKFFVSLNEDGTAKLFEFQGDFNEQKAQSDVKTLHPKVKQKAWRNMSDSKSNRDDSKVTFLVDGEKILDIAVSTDGKKIAACTNEGFVAVWDSNGRSLIHGLKSRVVQTPLTSVAFTMCNTRLYTLNVSVGSVIVLDASTRGYKTQFSFHPESDRIISLLSVPSYSNLILVLLATKLIHVQQRHGGDEYSGHEKKEFARLGDKGLNYICAAVTTDGKFVVTADTGGSINVFDLHEGFGLVKTYKNLVSSLDTQWLDDEKRHVICGGNRDTLVPMIHRWKFDPEEKPVVQRLPLFDATIEPNERTVIAVATSKRTVQILQNDEEIAETSEGSGRIIHLVISKDGNRVVYATDEGSVSIFHIRPNVSEKIFQLLEPVGFLKILNIGDKDVIVCGIGKQDLQIWKGPMSTQLVEYSGSVIFCDFLKSIELVLTVAETEVKLWDPKTWYPHTKKSTSQTIGKVTSCALSEGQNYLALANAAGKNVTLLKLRWQEKMLPSIVFEEHLAEKFDDDVTICSFSNDEKFLAVGFQNGNITIISVQTGCEICKLNHHRRPVKQLYWSPSSLEKSILVSLANELAWWSVSPEPDNTDMSSVRRQLSQSLSELTLSPQGAPKPGYIRTSKSLDLCKTEIMNASATLEDDVGDVENGSISSLTEDLLNTNGESPRISPWRKKVPRDSIPSLLGVVKIDGDVASKVCVSSDFRNFVTINGDGSIYNLTIFEERNCTDSNGGA